MKKYIMKRIIISAITLLVILFVLFLMLELMPGSPFNDEKLTEVQRAALNAKYGLDKPVYIRFLTMSNPCFPVILVFLTPFQRTPPLLPCLIPGFP